jgi:hypothetical protein
LTDPLRGEGSPLPSPPAPLGQGAALPYIVVFQKVYIKYTFLRGPKILYKIYIFKRSKKFI